MIAEGYVTGKAYEYLAAGRPVLAVTRGRDLTELIDKSSAGTSVSPENPEGIADALLELFARRNESFHPDSSYLTRYDRRHITAELAELFDDLTVRESH